MTLKRIHVNQHVIKRNAKVDLEHCKKNRIPLDKVLDPPLTCKNSKDNNYGYEIIINEHTSIVYRPWDPLSCGARVWIETKEPVKIRQSIDSDDLKEMV